MRLLFTFIFLCTLAANSAETAKFVPGSFEQPDGALLVYGGGNFVDPYFATKALIIAHDAGLDINQSARAWIKWALAHQNPDGRFRRFCHEKDGSWNACKDADADDALLALWLQLLYRMAPNSGIPPEWQESIRKSSADLAELRNKKNGLYFVARHKHTYLFMDNVEVYGALKDIGKQQQRIGERQAGRKTATDADVLAKAIQHNFWIKKSHRYMPVAGGSPEVFFYPDIVGQTYPMLENLGTPEEDASTAFSHWLQQHGSDWLFGKHDSPWGLIALTAYKLNYPDTAQCWLQQSAPLRHGHTWDILEEAAFQALSASLGSPEQTHPDACSRSSSSAGQE